MAVRHGLSAILCLSHYISHSRVPALQLSCAPSAAPLVPVLASGHTAGELSSGMWDRSGGNIGCDTNSLVNSSHFILLP